MSGIIDLVSPVSRDPSRDRSSPPVAMLGIAPACLVVREVSRHRVGEHRGLRTGLFRRSLDLTPLIDRVDPVSDQPAGLGWRPASVDLRRKAEPNYC